MLCVFCRKRVMVYPVSVYWWLVFACVLIHPWENKDHSTRNKGVVCEVTPHDIVFGYNHLQFYKMADVATLKSSCFGYIGQLNKKYREIEILLMDYSNAEAVTTKNRRLSEVFELFERKVVEYCEATSESVPDFQSAEVNHQEFQTRIQDWLGLVEAEKQKSGQKLKTESESGRHGNGDNGCSVMPPGGENVNQNRAPSVKSHSSRGSSRASGKLSTTRLKEARIKRELAKLRAEQLAAEQKLIQEQLATEQKLVHEKDELALLKVKNEYDQANLECTFLEEDDVSDVDVQSNDVKPGQACPIVQYPVNVMSDGENVDSVGNNQLHEDTKKVTCQNKCESGVGFVGNTTGVQCGSVNNPVCNVTNDLPSLVNAMLLNLNIPKQEISSFDGDPAEYYMFIHNFEVNIESKVVDSNSRLTYLLQYCQGKAKRSIENCVLFGSDGYVKAREILQMQYGHPHVVAHSMLDKLCSRNQIKPNDVDALWDLAREVQSCQITLSKIGGHTSTDQLLKIQRILPFRLQGEWAKRASAVIQIGREPTLDDMSRFIQNSALTSSTVFGRCVGQYPNSELMKPKVKVKGGSGPRAGSFAVTAGNVKQQPVSKPVHVFNAKVCVCCSGSHKLEDCHNFKQMSLENRLSLVREKRMCDNCFYPYHYARGCMSKAACTHDGCGKKHHTLLHFSQDSSGSVGTQVKQTAAPTSQTSSNAVFESTGHANNNTGNDEGNSESLVQVASSFATDSSRVGVYLRVVPVVVKGPDREIETLALLDNGSQISLCSKKLFELVGIQGEDRPLTMSTMNGVKHMDAAESNIIVKSVTGSDVIEMSVTAVDNMPVSCTLPSLKDVSKWKHLSNVEFHKHCSGNSEVLLLIGADVPEVFWVLEERRGGKKQPYAIKSILGWTLSGPANSPSTEEVGVGCFLVTDLMGQVKKFWETDFGDSLLKSDKDVGMSVEDRRAKAIMDDTVTMSDGHYMLGLLWRSPDPYLPDNYQMAKSRLSILKRKFLRDKSLHEKYTEVVEGYLEKGFGRVVPQTTESQSESKTELRWYLPHHPVYHPHKPGKTRVVFDCSANYGGTSLNDQLLKGPDFLNRLVGVLTRFREERVAIVADVEAMFHHVRVIERDCGALRFLWWPHGDIAKEPVDHQMLVHIFGATSSPSCASYALRKSATDNASDFDKLTVSTVLNDFYVDDCLESVKTTEVAKRLVSQLCAILAKGGFRLTKWLSNVREVIVSIPEQERAGSVKDIDLDHLPIERTLGVQWNVEGDSFEFHVVLKQKEETRRGILSMISSIFDPLGFLAPFILLAKLLLQELCRQGLDWDQTVSAKDLGLWQDWLADLPKLSEVSIPRCFHPVDFEPVTYQLHSFSDASNSAYASVTYLRMVDGAGRVHCAFVMGKSRLSPLKVISIPRLELSAALLAVNVCQIVKAELRYPISDVMFWTDSTAVLHYIQNESRRFHTFVANRVAKIQSVTIPSQWHYVDSKQNPADDGSRGLRIDEFIENDRWLKGPEFLWKDPGFWPESPMASERTVTDWAQDPEVRKETQMVSMVTDEENVLQKYLSSFSSWFKLKRAVAWLLRFRQYLLTRKRSPQEVNGLKKSPLTVSELKHAEKSVIAFVQRECFPDVVQALKGSKGTPVKLSGNLVKLCPMLKDGILRVGGRLREAPLQEDVKHPMILPSDHHVTRLIIGHYHELVGHSGAGMTWSSLRQRYWILKGGATVRHVIGKCFPCRRRNAPLGEQIMGELPVARVTPEQPPFTNTGVDYFGPIMVKQGRSQVKRYGCLFTCLAIRAVHLEVAHTLNTDSFLNALRRFMNRRGVPKRIFSDNGTNFIGGERELREGIQSFNQQKIHGILLQKEVEWNFNPPLASHMGGVWERMVKSVKKIMKALLKEQVVRDEILLTIFSEVESILNSRPITEIHQDAKDSEPLTPNHLLLLRPNTCLPPGVFQKVDGFGIRAWRQAQYLADRFWQRWLKEYLPLLQLRQRWTVPRRNLKVGDLVLVLDESVPRGQWPMGRVIKVYPDKAGWVRQVDVRVSAKDLKRPITKLCFLESTQ